jgi:hypothetical protein
MMKISQFLSIAVLGLCSFAASAATVWSPTDGNVNFIQFDGIDGLSTHGGTLAMFDSASFGNNLNVLMIGAAGGQVAIANTGSGWTATMVDKYLNPIGSSINLTSDSFTLGMTWDSGVNWAADSAHTPNTSPDSYVIDFEGVSKGVKTTGHTLAVDLQPVPVPAAAWLFGTGLIGLVGVARRRRA